MTTDLKFGRVEQFDEASRAYGVSRHLAARGATAIELRTWRWSAPRPAPLDQKNTSECVAFTGAHLLIAEPVLTQSVGAALAHTFYRECKAIDGISGEGTSVLAGAKVLKKRGFISSYSWAFSESELAAAVCRIAPVMLGMRWRRGMMEPGTDGFLHLTGSDLGGHCTLAVALDLERDAYGVLSSWGPDWADNGIGWIKRADMAKLLKDRADACVPIQVGADLPTEPADPADPKPTTPPKPTPPPVKPPTPPKPARPRRPRRPGRRGAGE